MMHGREKSDPAIVAVKPANKAANPAVEQSAAEPATAEPVEPRAGTKGNADQQSTCRAQSRLQKFALTLHPEKTRLIEFGRFAAERRQRRGLGKPETFNFLGFTFICGKTRAGRFQIKRKTRADRMRAKLREIKQEMRRRMHQPIPAQGRWLERVVRGYFNYHAVPTNGQALEVFRHHVTNLWRRTLRRRSQKGRMTWARMMQLVDAWLPKPIILHPWPSDRFA